jgi:two-component sensor histidine kinase
MEQTSWTRRPLPTVPPGPLVAWEQELRTPIDLTVGRDHLRRMVRRTWLRHCAPVDVEGLLLVFEELTSNGLCHGRSPVHVRVTATSRGWLVDVVDAAVERPPATAVDRDPADGGLGLPLVARLCRVHGWTVEDGCKHVWARVQAA